MADLTFPQAGDASWAGTGGTPGAKLNDFLNASKSLPDKVGRLRIDVKDHGAVGDGVADDSTPFANALAAFGASGGILYIPAGTYRVSQQVLPDKPIRIVGAGQGSVTIKALTDSGYLFTKTTTNTVRGYGFEGITFDGQNGTNRAILRLEYVTGSYVRDCRFVNMTQWGIVLGVANGADTVVRNTDVVIERCTFEAGTSTYEHVLVLNSQRITIEDCSFNVTASSSWAIGLYQVNDRVTVKGCQFSGAGKGMYYSLSVDRTQVQGCDFQGLIGIEGANQSDNGAFGSTHVLGFSAEGNHFSVTGAYALQLGAVRGATVTGNVFSRCQEAAVIVDNGNSPVAALPRGLSFTGNQFRENNQANNFHILHPGILVNTGASTDLDMVISGNSFWDVQGTPTQRYPVAFIGAFTYDDLVIVGNDMPAYGGGASVGLDVGTVIGTTRKVNDNSNWLAPSTGLDEAWTTSSQGSNRWVVEDFLVGEANARFRRQSSGYHEWGPGSAGADTNLYRGAADLLQTDSALLTQSGAEGAGAKPEDHTLLAWAFDPTGADGAGSLLTNGVILLVSVFLRVPQTIAKVGFSIAVAGSGLTAGQNHAGLYDSAGNRLSTGSADTAFTATGYQTVTLGAAQAVTPGRFYVALLANGTTPPALAAETASAATANAGLTATTARFATNSAGQTSLPSTITLSGNTIATPVWACLD